MGSISRRDLIRAGAWSVPAVAVAVAVPAAAASTLPAGTVNQVFVYQQFANSVNWTWNATNTSGDTAQLTVTLDLGSSVATISAPGARSESYPFTITIP